MKKLLSLIFISVFLISCSSKEPEITDVIIEAPVVQSFFGEIQKLTLPLDEINSSYYLLTESKNRIYLSSLIFDLEDYVDYSVKLKGNLEVLTLANKPVDYLIVDQIDIISTPEIIEDSQFFSSSEKGIEFEYNFDFLLEEYDSRITLQNTKTRELITLNFISKLDTELSFEQYISFENPGVYSETFRTTNHSFEMLNVSPDNTKYYL